MSLLAIGDLHADKLNHLIPNFTRLVTTCLKNTVESSLERGVTDIILVGDIFDSPTPTQTTMVQVLSTLSKLDVTVHLLLGNHDFSEMTTHSLQIAKWLSTSKSSNIRVITEPTDLTVDDVKYLVLPHPHVYDLPKKYDFGIGHFPINGSKADNGFKIRSKHSPRGKWLLGDLHFPHGGRVKGCYYTYVGSLTQLGWIEKPKKRVILVEDGEMTSVPVELTYKLKKVKVSSEEDLEKIGDDPKVFYNIMLSNYVLPLGYLSEHPNVLKTSPISKPTDKRAQVLLEDTEFTLDPLAPLEPFLRNKKYNEGIIKRSISISKTLRA